MKVCPACGSDQPTLVSLFDGIGGFPLAFTRAGYRVVALVEIDKAAAGVAADHFPEAKHFADVREVTADDLIAAGFCPVCGIVAAGFPCQDLSLAGRRAGLDGARSGLFFEIVRIVAGLRCRWLVLENVPGLLSSVCPCVGDDACGAGCTDAHTVRGGACGPGRCIEIHGGAMGAVLGAVAELGYGFAYRVLDAQHFGVPQRRRRVFVVGCLGDGAAPAAVLLEPDGGERDSVQGREARSRAADRTPDGVDGSGVVNALTSNMAGGGGGVDDNTAQGGHLVARAVLARPERGPEYDGNIIGPYQGHGTNVGPMGTLRAGSGTVAGGVPFTLGGQGMRDLTAEGADASEDGTGRGTPIVSAPLTASMGGNHGAPGNGGMDELATASAAAGAAVRRLTPTECERLQGYPDGWTARSYGEPQADSGRYRQLGNSIAVPVVEWIARRMAEADA